jgi:hypothetical protein
VLGAGAGAERCRAKPVDPAGEVSCEWAGRELAHAAAIRELVITTDPLSGELLLREGMDSLLFSWWGGVGVDSDGAT